MRQWTVYEGICLWLVIETIQISTGKVTFVSDFLLRSNSLNPVHVLLGHQTVKPASPKMADLLVTCHEPLCFSPIVWLANLIWFSTQPWRHHAMPSPESRSLECSRRWRQRGWREQATPLRNHQSWSLQQEDTSCHDVSHAQEEKKHLSPPQESLKSVEGLCHFVLVSECHCESTEGSLFSIRPRGILIYILVTSLCHFTHLLAWNFSKHQYAVLHRVSSSQWGNLCKPEAKIERV